VSFKPDSPFVGDVISSDNIGDRRSGLTPSILVMHYTGLPTIERAIEVLSDPVCEVSCHYVIDLDGRIIQMVAEAKRAWHAGLSSWHAETDINSMSIGIEIHNLGQHTGNTGYPDFPDRQMQAVERLSRDIITRHHIKPCNVVGHSDIAPGRKTDPGEKFDWRRLHAAGIGHWVAPGPLDPADQGYGPGDCSDAVGQFQLALKSYGYGLKASGILDDWTQTVVMAFQRHFRPARIDGRIDRSTIDTLDRLIEAAG